MIQFTVLQHFVLQSRIFLNEGKENNLKAMFNCGNRNHLIAEFFYLIANYYSSDGEHQISNFYLNLKAD